MKKLLILLILLIPVTSFAQSPIKISIQCEWDTIVTVDSDGKVDVRCSEILLTNGSNITAYAPTDSLDIGTTSGDLPTYYMNPVNPFITTPRAIK